MAISGMCLTAQARNAGFLSAGEPDAAAADTLRTNSAASVVHIAAATASGTASPAADVAAAEQTEELQTVNDARSRRGLVSINNEFVPKGQWIFGGYASYSTHVNNNYTFVILENIDSDGYTFKVSPMVGYAVSKNMAVGARFIYSRTVLRVDNGELNLGDGDSGTHITADYYYSLKHSYSVAAIWRQYIPLGRNKRFAIFNEISLAAGGHQSKFAADVPLRGTYETGYEVSLGMSPGLIAFATNTMAVEVNVGVMGISYNSSHQVHNQVETADIRSSFMNFKVSLLSIGLGVSFYL